MTTIIRASDCAELAGRDSGDVDELYNPADHIDYENLGSTGLEHNGACTLCGTPLEDTYCPSCSADRAAVEPFVLELADEETHDTEPCPPPAPPIDLGSLSARLKKAGAPALVVSAAICAVRRAQTLADISAEGIPVAEAPARSGVAFDARGLSWVLFVADDVRPPLDVEQLFALACEVVERCGYVVSRRSARELWADVYEPVARGAA